MRNLLAHALSSDLSLPEAKAGERAGKATDRVLREGFWQMSRASGVRAERSTIAPVLSLDEARAKKRARFRR